MVMAMKLPWAEKWLKIYILNNKDILRFPTNEESLWKKRILFIKDGNLDNTEITVCSTHAFDGEGGFALPGGFQLIPERISVNTSSSQSIVKYAYKITLYKYYLCCLEADYGSTAYR